jgi:hypothetical protein
VPPKVRRVVPAPLLDRWADELVAIRRDVIDGHAPDLDLLRNVTREIRLTAGGYPLDGTTEEGS